jgi:exoribonuclease-2
LSPVRLIEHCGELPSSHDYHLGRFLHEFFPRGMVFPPDLRASVPTDLPLAQVSAFSLDDAGTTEIDDAFSITSLGAGKVRIGIHIAAPGLGFARGSGLDAVARSRLSTVYFPGSKITMLPPDVIQQFSLAEGSRRPALSLYLDVLEDGFEIQNRHSAIELLPMAANIRHHETELLDRIFAAGEPIPSLPYASELHLLWRFATSLEAARGKPSSTPERPEYSFHVEGERVRIDMRRRGAPMDKLVAELMVLLNSTWGKLLDDHEVPAIYRVQANGKVRMSTGAGGHQGLGVSHYAWSSSPLRRYIDLINQWQLLALLSGEAPPFRKNDAELLAAVSDFEASYAAYGEFQRNMEFYWSLRWLIQEDRKSITGEVLRDNLVRVDALPVVLRVPSLPELAPGSRVELAVAEIDLLENVLKCRFVQALEPALT